LYTAVYLLHDRVDEAGNQKYGFYKPDYTPRLAAVYLHNLTTILQSGGKGGGGSRAQVTVLKPPTTVHDLLLKKRNGEFAYVLWSERVKGSDEVKVDFGTPVGSVLAFDPTLGTDRIAKYEHVKSVTLKLSDHPIVLQFRQNTGVNHGRN
jgi:hypothetical protein